MQLLENANFNIIGNRNVAFIISAILIIASIALIAADGGPNLSIDFSGGTLLQVKFDETLTTEEKVTFDSLVNSLDDGSPEIKTIGSDNTTFQVIVKGGMEIPENATAEERHNATTKVQSAFSTKLSSNDVLSAKLQNKTTSGIRMAEIVGPKVGKDLGKNAVMAIILSLLVIVVYIGLRFRFPYGVAAILALAHDVIITLGVFALLNWEVSLPIIAAILTIVGYSLNDTIVVFDRIRENTKANQAKKDKDSFEDVVNSSINQTLSRTIITSLTTFVVVLSIFIAFFGTANILEFFSGALIVGIISGTYSSIFIASPTLIIWNRKKPIEPLEEN